MTFGERPGATYTGVTTDTYIDQIEDTTPHGDVDQMKVFGGTQNGVGRLRCELSAVSAWTKATSAISLATPNVPSNGSFGLYRMNQAWIETATYQLPRPPQVGQWAGLGATPPARATDSAALGARATMYAFSVTLQPGLVQEWINNPNDNQGLALVSEPGSTLVTTRAGQHAADLGQCFSARSCLLTVSRARYGRSMTASLLALIVAVVPELAPSRQARRASSDVGSLSIVNLPLLARHGRVTERCRRRRLEVDEQIAGDRAARRARDLAVDGPRRARPGGCSTAG